jgi:hypothetical protein
MESRHRIVVALVGEALLRTEGSTSRRLFSLIESQFASPQWDNGLTRSNYECVVGPLCISEILLNMYSHKMLMFIFCIHSFKYRHQM